MSGQDATAIFEIAIPPRWRQIDLLATAEGSALPDDVSTALIQASRLGHYGTILLVRALMTSETGVPPVSAGLVATLANPGTAPVATPLDTGGFGDADVSAVELAIGSGLRIQRVLATEILRGVLAPAFLSVQYLLETDSGFLTITFTTAQGNPSAEWEALFAAMAVTSRFA